MVDPVRVHVIFSFLGLLRLSFLPKVLGGAAPFSGGTTSGFGARRLAPDYGQPPLRSNDRSQMKIPVLRKICSAMDVGTGLTG